MQAPAFELPKRCAHLGKVALRHVCAFSPKRSLPLQPALHFSALPDRNPEPRATWPLSRLKSSYKNRLRSLQLSSHQPEKSPHRGASMKKTASVFLLAAMLLSLEQAQANDKRGAVPSKVLSAKTIYVDNQTNDAELQHDAYMGLNKWGRYEIVDSPQKADIVLRLSGSSVVKFVPGGDPAATYNPKPVSEKSGEGQELAPPGCTRLMLIEPKSGTALWLEVRKTSNPQEKGRLLDGLHQAVDQQEKGHNR
jgi:hypothetical protein